MKISCTQENLNQGLFVVSHISSKNTALPILNNVLIQAREKTIKLSATNLEMGVSCVIRGKIEEEGEFTVQSKLLADYIGFLPKQQIDLSVAKNVQESQDQILDIHCKNHATKIKGQLASDFPLIPQIEKTKPYVLDCQKFRQAVSQVIFSVSISETRPEINGVSFEFTGQKLVLAATDSYRLAEKTISLEKKSLSVPQKIIVPTRTLQELQRILGSFKDPAALSELKEIEIYLSENQILFVLDGIELISRLVEGQYPDYRQIIPQTIATKSEVGTLELIKATKATSLFARSGIYDVNLEILPDEKEVVISSTNNQLGENISQVSASVEGVKNNIVVNYRYLLDGLQNVDADSIEIDVIDSTNPCVLKPVGKTSDYIYIIMPIKQ